MHLQELLDASAKAGEDILITGDGASYKVHITAVASIELGYDAENVPATYKLAEYIGVGANEFVSAEEADQFIRTEREAWTY